MGLSVQIYIYISFVMKTGVYLSPVGEKKKMGGLDLRTQTGTSFLKSLQRHSPQGEVSASPSEGQGWE